MPRPPDPSPLLSLAPRLERWAARRALRLRLLLAVMFGAVAALGQAPFDLWPVALIGLAGLFGLFHTADTPRRAALIGWAGGTGYFALALVWIVEPFMVDAVRFGWMAPFALLFLATGLALFWGAGFALARGIGGRAGRQAAAWVGALALAELARSYVFTGFPWALIGHIWVPSAMLQWGAVLGPLGLTLIALAAAVTIWRLFGPRPRVALVSLVVLAAMFGAGAWRAATGPAPRGVPVVRLVQPNAKQSQKWDPEVIPTIFRRQIEYTAAGAARPDLIVWPETAVPVLLEYADTTLAVIAEAAAGVPMVLGIQREDGPRLYNSAIVLGKDGQVSGLYDKHHLVPFGEYMPLGDLAARFGVHGLAAAEGQGYSAGPGARLFDLGDLGLALPLICYEAVFAQDVSAAPKRPAFLLQITNDAWFGQFSGPYQHLAQARLRAVEQGLPMVRVANTGVSAMIDARGRVTASLPLGRAGWIDAPLPAPGAVTIYADTGDSPAALLSLALLLFAFVQNAAIRARKPD
ncbi:apolipoprotein N-acyltransferase [Thalassovita taeanensis]|uniref:Apolipoprotein N-acyltransferase n=1 Tax=Thalassovita taeanensis TaxID=657014 RepID=A0A1H9HI81_9RHOB|nr:apolipoprotein N-acyltransferase [Thalassovita taeanensis]SEQ62060.1 Apolipoprotein N-acyltransferase [Thalassovita taeanensis]